MRLFAILFHFISSWQPAFTIYLHKDTRVKHPPDLCFCSYSWQKMSRPSMQTLAAVTNRARAAGWSPFPTVSTSRTRSSAGDATKANGGTKIKDPPTSPSIVSHVVSIHQCWFCKYTSTSILFKPFIMKCDCYFIKCKITLNAARHSGVIQVAQNGHKWPHVELLCNLDLCAH